MTNFDFATATPAEVRAEAARRHARRANGGSVVGEDAPTGRIEPDAMRVVFFVPWSCLCPDNEKYAPALRDNKPVLILTPKYRHAKRSIGAVANEAMGEQGPMAGRVRLQATLVEPDTRTRRDPTNWAKVTSDALNGIVYGDDSQIDVAEWRRGAVNIDRPGLAVVVETIPSEVSHG